MKTSRLDSTLLSKYSEVHLVSVFPGTGSRLSSWRWRWPSGCCTCWAKRCRRLMVLISLETWQRRAPCRTWWERSVTGLHCQMFCIKSACSSILTLHIVFFCWCLFYLNSQLVSCGVSSYQHTSVSLEFFETVVRYDKFFIVEPQHIPNVLVSDCVGDLIKDTWKQTQKDYYVCFACVLSDWRV